MMTEGRGLYVISPENGDRPAKSSVLNMSSTDQAVGGRRYCAWRIGSSAPPAADGDFLIGSEGLLMFMPDSLADEDAKDDFATNARLMCIAYAATSVVMALEAWVRVCQARRKV